MGCEFVPHGVIQQLSHWVLCRECVHPALTACATRKISNILNGNRDGPICMNCVQNALQDVGMEPWSWSALQFVALSLNVNTKE